MIERSDEPDRFTEQHAVAEHIPTHVADSDDCDRIPLGIDVVLAEVSLHRFPCAASRDAHFLVVIAMGTARRECVT